jgi:glycosyltransferase involved in cell wall biosynthesis
VTIGYLGALTVAKGIGVLSRWLKISPGDPHRIAGDGPLAPRSNGRRACVRRVRRGAAKDAFLAACDIGVVPSLWEEPSGPPYVVGEWLAAGRPVLTSDRGGLAESEV